MALAGLDAPALVIGGGLDLQRPPVDHRRNSRPCSADAQLVVQPGAGHFPWLDDAGRFVAAVSEFLE